MTASAMVLFLSMMSYHSVTGSWLAMTVAFLPCLSSSISMKSSSCCPSSFLMPKSSMISRSVSAVLSKNLDTDASILARLMASSSLDML